MKNVVLILSTLFIRSSFALSCCAEPEYRLLPIGELNEHLIFIEFDFHRNCRMRNAEKGEFNFFVRGTVNLVTYENDSLVFLENIDTLSIETAFWKEQVQWHGISKDYYRIRKK